MTGEEGSPVLSGGCQCGEVRYEIRGAPLETYVCHCRECRKQSASAFGISVAVKSGDLMLIAGAPRSWTRPATIQGSFACAFCPTCGSRLWHGDPDSDDWVSVKGGSLDTPPNLTRAKHIWVKRKLSGVVIPEGVATYPEEPPAE